MISVDVEIILANVSFGARDLIIQISTGNNLEIYHYISTHLMAIFYIYFQSLEQIIGMQTSKYT